MPELENESFVPLESDTILENPIAETQSNVKPVEVERRKKRVSLYWKRPKR